SRPKVSSDNFSVWIARARACVDVNMASAKSLSNGVPGSLFSASLCRSCPVAAFRIGAGAFSRRDRLYCGQRFNFALDGSRLLVTDQTQIVIGLQAGPHFRARAKVARQPQRRVRRDTALFQND